VQLAAWAQLVGGEAAQGGGSLGPSSASSSGAGMMQAGGAFSLSSIKMIDPAPLFKAAQTGDVRTLAQLSLKMIEGANSTIGALGQQVGVGRLTAVVAAHSSPHAVHPRRQTTVTRPDARPPRARYIIRLLRPGC
jgi:hypothetical protein